METRHHRETENQNHLKSSFEAAGQSVTDAANDLEFRHFCEARGVDPTDRKQPAYWALVADREWNLSRDESLSGFDAYAHAISGSTPNAIMHSLALEHPMSFQEAKAHKIALSRYNALVRDFAADYPATSAATLTEQLQRVALISVAGDSKRTQTTADRLLRDIVHGAQHELGFQAVIEASGLDFRQTTDEEDLRGGDYMIKLPDGREIKIDVKASLSEIDKKNHGHDGQPYTINREGDVVIYSCLSATDLNDRFTVDRETAETRVPILMGALFQAAKAKAA